MILAFLAKGRRISYFVNKYHPSVQNSHVSPKNQSRKTSNWIFKANMRTMCCCIASCGNTSDETKTKRGFFHLPTDEKRLNTWTKSQDLNKVLKENKLTSLFPSLWKTRCCLWRPKGKKSNQSKVRQALQEIWVLTSKNRHFWIIWQAFYFLKRKCSHLYCDHTGLSLRI